MARVVVARCTARCCGLAGIVGALFTAIYIFRLVFLVFFGESKTHVHGHLDLEGSTCR